MAILWENLDEFADAMDAHWRLAKRASKKARAALVQKARFEEIGTPATEEQKAAELANITADAPGLLTSWNTAKNIYTELDPIPEP